MDTADLSFTAAAKRFTVGAFRFPREISVILSETVSRIAAFILMSPAGICDFVMHSAFIIPTFIYACGKSMVCWKAHFNLPWQHLKKIGDAFTMTMLGSPVSLIHPILDYSSLNDRMSTVVVN